MNHIIRQDETIRRAQPASGSETRSDSLDQWLGPCRDAAEAALPRPDDPIASIAALWPGWPAWLLAGLRRYVRVRRTLRAFDHLSDELLRDIGYRRAPGERWRYEKLP